MRLIYHTVNILVWSLDGLPWPLMTAQKGWLACPRNFVWKGNNNFQELVTLTWKRKKKKDCASLCKWQSGMRFQGWARDEVWRANGKARRLHCTDLQATQGAKQHALMTDRIKIAVRWKDFKWAKQFKKFAREQIIMNHRFLTLYPEGRFNNRPTKPASPTQLSVFVTAVQGVLRVSDSFLQHAYSWAYP